MSPLVTELTPIELTDIFLSYAPRGKYYYLLTAGAILA